MAYNYEFPYTDAELHNDDWLLKAVKEVRERVESLEAWKELNQKQYEEIKQLYDDIVAGNFPEAVRNAFADWMRENAIDLVGQLVQTVFFRIDDNGYFVADIPGSWKDIIFNTTGLDISVAGIDYGHLTLSY